MKQIEILELMDKGAILSYHHQYYDDPPMLHLCTEDGDIDHWLRINQLDALERKGFVYHFRSMNPWNDQYRITDIGKKHLNDRVVEGNSA